MSEPGVRLRPAAEPEGSRARVSSYRRVLSAGRTEGDAEHRLRRMIDEHFDLVWRLARRLGVPEPDVDDAVQQVFWVAARRLDDILPGRERAFLGATAVRVASDARRARRRHPEDATGDVGSREDPSPLPDDLAERKASRAVLDRILDDLPTDLRSVFVLFELEELTTPEIADLLDLPLGTAASRLRRARRAFRAAVGRWQQRWSEENG